MLTRVGNILVDLSKVSFVGTHSWVVDGVAFKYNSDISKEDLEDAVKQRIGYIQQKLSEEKAPRREIFVEDDK